MAKALSLLSLPLLSFLLPFTSSNTIPIATPFPPLTAHRVLSDHGFPVGLLPSAVRTYTLNNTSGQFAVVLGRKCQVTLPPDNYLAVYSKTITGKIVEGKIAELSGIRVWAFFKWWSLTGIKSSGENLVFEVGVVTAKYPAKNFGVSPECEGKRDSS